MKLNPLNVLFWIGYLFLMGRIVFKVLQGRLGKPRTVRAEVVGKQTVEFFSKYAAGGKRVKYAVTFLIDGKKKSFYVSEFSYGGYRRGERGQLTYQGDRLIDFS